MTESIGMMDGAFFVPKSELINWINNTFKFNITKVEEACTGAIYCQIIEAIHPGEINLTKVNWKARLEHEYLNNYKLLQQAFNKCNITKNIDTEKLIKGRTNEHIEFLQFLKRYFELKFKCQEYDPVARRKGNELVNPFTNVQTSKSKDHKSTSIKKDFGLKFLNKENESKKENLKNMVNIQPVAVEKEGHLSNEEVKTLRGMVTELETERDFYLSKLRDIEFLTQNADLQKISGDEMKNAIMEILLSKVEVKVAFDEEGHVGIKAMTEIGN